ncbi:hypothetical protein D3C84_627370 [compost metagenome]
MYQRPGNHQATLHAARQRARRHITLVPQTELGQVLLGTFLGNPGRNAVVTRLGHHDVEGLFELVEVEFLWHHPDAALERGRVAVQVVAKDIHRAAGLVHQGRKNADGRGFAGAIGAEQGEKVTFGDIQIDTTQGLETVAVGFG